MSNQRRLPNPGEYVRGAGRLVEVQTIPPPPPPPPEQHFIFESITAHCELRLKKQVIETFNNVWDFYGEGTSVEDAIEKAKARAKRDEIDKHHPLEVVAIRIKTLTRKRPKDSETVYQKEFKTFEELPMYENRKDLPEPTVEVVWTSRNPDQEVQ